jgi:pyrimidine-nucleoside phosphorylase
MDVPDVMEITHTLAGVMLTMGNISKGINEGIELSKKSIASGEAYKKFTKMVIAQDGDISYIEDIEKYDISKYSIDVKADRDGYISDIDALQIGLIGIEIGIGRKKVDDVIDHKTGIIFRKTISDLVQEGDTLATIYTEKEDVLKFAKQKTLESFTITKNSVTKDLPIISIMGDINL